ncbi:MAG: peptidase S10 [Terracidiphilus sp.]|jgi:carboxypeptidase C (cathepsin A)
MNILYRRFAVFTAAASLLFVGSACAQDDKPAAKPATADKTAEATQPADSTTQGAIDVGGQHIAYTAIAGTITVGSTDEQDAQLGPDGKPQPGSELLLDAPDKAKDAPPVARMFYVAYFKTGAKAEDRPVTFFYNGGPGSSTVWLHMGSLGPKHVVTAGDTHLPAAPYTMVDNPNSLLDVSDLVFIDMPGTGFGRLMGKDAEKTFWGIDGDAGAFARFIERFDTKYSRWNSPKFIFGESYGTTRSAVLADLMENKYDTDLNGVILLSQIFNFTTDIDVPGANPGVDLPYVLGLPTYAATAFYHKKLPTQPAALEPFLSEVEQFAMGPYAHALALGTDVGADEKQQVAEKLHEYTGLPVAYLLKANLRVSGPEFEKTLQDDSDMTTGRLDTRFSGPNLNPLSENAEYDPQSSAISSAYVSLFNDYVRRDLKYGDGLTYVPEIYDEGVGHWDFKHNGNPVSVNVAPDLAEAMKTNSRLKVMVNGGYYDLATPFFAAQYEDKHLPIPQSLAKNIEYDWYESGHMVYVRDECVKQLHDRVAAFITSTDAAAK